MLGIFSSTEITTLCLLRLLGDAYLMSAHCSPFLLFLERFEQGWKRRFHDGAVTWHDASGLPHWDPRHESICLLVAFRDNN